MENKSSRQQIQSAEILAGLFDAAFCDGLAYETSAQVGLDNVLTIVFFEPRCAAKVTAEIHKTGLLKSCIWQEGNSQKIQCKADLSGILDKSDPRNTKPRKL